MTGAERKELGDILRALQVQPRATKAVLARLQALLEKVDTRSTANRGKPKGLVDEKDFWTRVNKDPETGCWHFLGTVRKADGMVLVTYARKTYYARRLAFQLHNGFSAADMRVIRVEQSCSIKDCVNPEHLREHA